MNKSSPKTMRFSDDVLEYIENFDGKDFTDKFHNLVRWFMKTEAEKRATIESLDKQIEDRRKRLNELTSILYNVSWLEDKFKALDKSISAARDSLASIIDPNKKY